MRGISALIGSQVLLLSASVYHLGGTQSGYGVKKVSADEIPVVQRVPAPLLGIASQRLFLRPGSKLSVLFRQKMKLLYHLPISAMVRNRPTRAWVSKNPGPGVASPTVVSESS